MVQLPALNLPSSSGPISMHLPAVNPLHDEDDGEDQIKAIRPGLSAKLSEELFSSTQAVGMCTHH